jgi:hypothetical protein
MAPATVRRKTRPMADRLASRRRSIALLVTLPASFALTVLGFLASTIITEVRARGIEVAADAIATSSAPAIYRRANATTDLRRLEVRLDDYATRVTAGAAPSGELAARLRASRATFEGNPEHRVSWMLVSGASRVAAAGSTVTPRPW